MLEYSLYTLVHKASVMELSSALTLEMLGKPFLLEKRIVLLHAIKEHGSISKAAKAVPMSYKSAWEAVDMMNSLSPEPIVCTETGGKDGGGTTITDYGEKLLKNYALLKEEHTRFLSRLSELTDIENGTFKTIGRLAIQLSARNQIQAEIVAIEPLVLEVVVVLKLKNMKTIKAHITQEAMTNLQLKVGENVTAVFKSSAVKTDKKKTFDDDNTLEGVISSYEKKENRVQITVDIGAHDKIVSVLPSEIDSGDMLREGSSVKLKIKSSDIMIGK